MFQGGFVGTECDIVLIDNQDAQQIIHTIFPDDINDLQTFILPKALDVASTDKLQLKFKQSSDFYGRVTVYMIHFGGKCQ